MERLNNNKVKEVARMQQMIDMYESFIISILLMTKGKNDVTVPIFTDTNLEEEMGCIWKWVKEHK
jgi:hypothetical protein